MCNRAFETLSEEEIAFIQERMLPSKKEEKEEEEKEEDEKNPKKIRRISASGFLLPEDSLKEVYEADKKFLAKVEITYDQIADALITLVGKAIRKRHHHYEKTKDAWPKEGFLVDGRYSVKFDTYMGAQTCPFQDPTDTRYFGYEYGSTDVTITDAKSGKQLVFNTLLPHMIRYHHFFESPNVSHRLNPADVIEMFEIKTGQDMKATYWTEYYWTPGSGSTGIDDFERNITIRACEVLKVDKFENEEIICYMTPCELPISNKELIHIGNLIYELHSMRFGAEAQNSWENRRVLYQKARRHMFEVRNEWHRKMQVECPSLASPEDTEEKIQATIKMELDLAERYFRNDPADRLTGLDHCLVHPEDSHYYMYITTMIKKEDHGWTRKEATKFPMGGCEVKFSEYMAYQRARIVSSQYIPVEEDN